MQWSTAAAIISANASERAICPAMIECCLDSTTYELMMLSCQGYECCLEGQGTHLFMCILRLPAGTSWHGMSGRCTRYEPSHTPTIIEVTASGCCIDHCAYCRYRKVKSALETSLLNQLILRWRGRHVVTLPWSVVHCVLCAAVLVLLGIQRTSARLACMCVVGPTANNAASRHFQTYRTHDQHVHDVTQWQHILSSP